MNKQECTEAIKKAELIFVSVEIIEGSRRATRVSKKSALSCIQVVREDADLKVTWIDDDHTILLIG